MTVVSAVTARVPAGSAGMTGVTAPAPDVSAPPVPRGPGTTGRVEVTATVTGTTGGVVTAAGRTGRAVTAMTGAVVAGAGMTDQAVTETGARARIVPRGPESLTSPRTSRRDSSTRCCARSC